MKPEDQETRRRLDALVDPDAHDNDAYYHSQVATFRTWLRLLTQALDDEDVDDEVARRVVNRVVYGAPQPADAYLRRDEHARRLRELTAATPCQLSHVRI